MSVSCEPGRCVSACCNPVALPYTPTEAALNNGLAADERVWVRDDLTRLPTSEGLRRAPWLRGIDMVAKIGGEFVRMNPVFYECRHYDAGANRCTNYDDRPAVCSDYPWYQMPGVEREAAAIPPSCSFNADVGRRVEDRPSESLVHLRAR